VRIHVAELQDVPKKRPSLFGVVGVDDGVGTCDHGFERIDGSAVEAKANSRTGMLRGRRQGSEEDPEKNE
jgi:hypothetical protein